MADHGLSAYTNRRCRCEVCRAAMATYCRNRREQIRGNVPPEVPHGLIGTYNNYCCRCRSCRDAAAEYGRRRYWKRKEAVV